MQSERNELQSTGYQKKQKKVTEHTHMHQLSINARINQVQLLHCTLFRLNCSLPPGNKFHNTNSYLVFIFCNLLTTFRGMAAFELVNVLFCFVLRFCISNANKNANANVEFRLPIAIGLNNFKQVLTTI